MLKAGRPLWGCAGASRCSLTDNRLARATTFTTVSVTAEYAAKLSITCSTRSRSITGNFSDVKSNSGEVVSYRHTHNGGEELLTPRAYFAIAILFLSCGNSCAGQDNEKQCPQFAFWLCHKRCDMNKKMKMHIEIFVGDFSYESKNAATFLK